MYNERVCCSGDSVPEVPAISRIVDLGECGWGIVRAA